jgi:aspartokinase/homoserine dehydrogenase 1
MSFRVMKFGGTSVGSSERLASVLGIVRAASDGPCAVVVSAPGDATDWLIAAGEAAAAGRTEKAERLVDDVANVAVRAVTEALARHDARWPEAEATARELLDELRRLLGGVAVVADFRGAVRDHVLSFGERLSSKIVSGALAAIGVAARPIDARSWLVTDETFGSAKVDWEATAAHVAAQRDRWASEVTVHTGFLGATARGVTTTLGRNGSDYTATLLARALAATSVDIFTDVPGVMTADPWIEREAYSVPHLSYAEALELAGLGLKMFHPRTMVPLIESGIPMRIRSTLRPEAPGTLVDREGSSDPRRPTCVTSLEDLTLIDVEGTQRTQEANLGTRVLGALRAIDVPALFSALAPYGNGVAVAVPRADGARALTTIRELLTRELTTGALPEPRLSEPVTVLTLVAEAMGRTVGVAARFFGALGAAGVLIRASSQGATSRAIGAVIDGADTAVAVRAVHAAFNLAREQVSVLILGKGTVGGELVRAIEGERDALRDEHDVTLRIVGVADSSGIVFEPEGLGAEALAQLARREGSHATAEEVLPALARLPVPVLVDCSAAGDLDATYVRALELGVHVVTANKKPLVLPRERLARIQEAARSAHRSFRYETTCGAGLPVIETLKNLVRTGDTVRLVEGSLSGTLGFLCDATSGGARLSAAVRDALSRGYTEPHPRDDLTGKDAARKVLILARELGLSCELADVRVQPFVPTPILEHTDLPTFFEALAAHDAEFEAGLARLRAEGKVLRYLARIERRGAEAPGLTVGPVGVPESHPAARLRGSEAFVAFTTARYADYPLVVQGPGAGGAVTAAGVLADVLALSQTLRGR